MNLSIIAFLNFLILYISLSIHSLSHLSASSVYVFLCFTSGIHILWSTDPMGLMDKLLVVHELGANKLSMCLCACSREGVHHFHQRNL